MEGWCCAFSLRLRQLQRPGWGGSSLTTPVINFDHFDYFDDYFDFLDDDFDFLDDHNYDYEQQSWLEDSSLKNPEINLGCFGIAHPDKW